MICRRVVGLFVALPLAVGVSTAVALAQDGTAASSQNSAATTVVKSTPAATPAAPASEPIAPKGLTEPQDAVMPSSGEEPTGAAPPAEEIQPSASDEGAGWEAAVEAAQAPTPLIGEEQAKAVQRINAYFNGITNLQGSFEQVD